ncbi:MAG: hypothetical protein MZV65_29860 [Chromatiales bacterium]|nr:hypothetical protein [Chromatiales bacterium]
MLSENLRADWRGAGRLSAYQVAGAGCLLPYALAVVAVVAGGGRCGPGPRCWPASAALLAPGHGAVPAGAVGRRCSRSTAAAR